MGVGAQEIAHIRNAEGSAQIRSTINDSKDLVKQGNGPVNRIYLLYFFTTLPCLQGLWVTFNYFSHSIKHTCTNSFISILYLVIASKLAIQARFFAGIVAFV